MSIAIRVKRPIPAPIIDVEKTIDAMSTRPFRPRYAEAPDAGYRHAEAAESRGSSVREAPDAGQGRGQMMETHFNHGRSRS